jgi:hypothetical protein
MNITQIPPGGWQYFQPQTGWHAPFPVGMTHQQQVNNIIRHRLGNPAVVAKYKLATDPETVGRELIKYQQIRGALPADPAPKMTPPPIQSPRLVGAVSDAVAVVKKLAAGASALLEWESEGLPHAEPKVAEARAQICSKCPKNQEGRSLTEYFTVPVADLYNKRFKKMHDLNLTTPYDDDLKVCQACLCPMRTKVWFPKELILKRLIPEQRPQLNQINPRCWILDL